MDLFRLRLREAGLKVTPQRVAIFEELLGSTVHPTAEEVHELLQPRLPNVSLDTINRTLQTFARIGLVTTVEGYGSPRRYDPNLKPHHHVHCSRCGAIIDIYCREFDRLEIPAEVKQRFGVVGQRVVLNGVCPQCQEKRNKD